MQWINFAKIEVIYMIKINLSYNTDEKIKQGHKRDLFEKTNSIEDIKMHLTNLRNDGYKNFTNLFINTSWDVIDEKKIEKLLLLDSKKKFKEFIKDAEKAINLDTLFTERNREKIKQDILGDNKNGFLKFYKNFSTRKWAFEFLQLLNCNVCPYCNRIYTFTVNSKNKCKPEFDHFFPKDEFPYLSISIFNLIPSCSFCNKGKSNASVDNEFNHKLIYPYEEGFEDENLQIKFSFESDNINYLYGDFSDFKIKIKSKFIENENLMEEYNKNFKIDSLYSLHTDYVEEMLNKAIIYGGSMTKELLEQYSEMFSTQEEILKLVFGNYVEPKDFLKRPLSKLTHDLLEELGIYK